MKKYFLEIACFHEKSAIAAQDNGADRIELCAGFRAGGTTPDLAVIESTRKKVQLPLFVMIRPRGGNFTYTDEEFKKMRQDLINIKRLNVDGFVFGILHADGTVNKEQNEELVRLAAPLSCTFHRAFDQVPDPFRAMEEIISCGFRTILSSGKAAVANEGATLLACLVRDARNRIMIMPGGGVRSSAVAELKQKTNALFYHSSAITDGTEIADPHEIRRLKEKLC